MLDCEGNGRATLLIYRVHICSLAYQGKQAVEGTTDRCVVDRRALFMLICFELEIDVQAMVEEQVDFFLTILSKLLNEKILISPLF